MSATSTPRYPQSDRLGMRSHLQTLTAFDAPEVNEDGTRLVLERTQSGLRVRIEIEAVEHLELPTMEDYLRELGVVSRQVRVVSAHAASGFQKLCTGVRRRRSLDG